MSLAEASSRTLGEVRLRPPSVVMRLSRLGAFHQTRIRFLRSLLRRIAAEGWTLTRPLYDLDADGWAWPVFGMVREYHS